jgi:hypothetical protein
MFKKNSPSFDLNLKKYEDPGGLTIKRMNFGLWLAANRLKLIKFIVIFLIIVSAGMFIYSAYHYIFYFLYGQNVDKAMIISLSTDQLDNEAYRAANSPKDLEIGEVSIFSVSGKYDFLVKLKNINSRHFSSFNYCFRDAAGIDLACGESFILPETEKYLALAGKTLDKAPLQVKFVITELFWQRLNAHDIPDWQTYISTRLNLQISETKYSAPSFSTKNPFHNLSFKIKNNSPYSLSSVPLNIILWNGNRISGLNIYIVDNLLSAENRVVTLAWPAGGEQVSRVEIIPDFNVLNKDNYLPYDGATVK